MQASTRSIVLAGITALSALAAIPGQTQIVAFDVPTGASSNQFITNPLGMDFNVNSPILITALGVFDSNQDGLAASTNVYIYDRTTQLSVVTELIPAGTTAPLLRGSRFLDLPTPILLNAGFHGTVVEDPNVTDGNYNTSFGFDDGAVNSGGGLISFVGGGRVSDNGPGTYPARIDTGAPNHYYAGTFEFTSAATPEPGALPLFMCAGVVGGCIARRRRARHRSKGFLAAP